MHSSATRVLTALIAGGVLVGVTPAAFADDLKDTLEGNQTVSVTAGQQGTANVYLQAKDNDSDPGCNLDGGTEKIEVAFSGPTGVTADSITMTECGKNYPVTIKTSALAVSGNLLARIVGNTSGVADDAFGNKVSIAVSITQPTVVTPPPPPADTTDPTSSATATAAGVTYAPGGWTKETVTVTLSGHDAGGTTEIHYTTDGSTPTAASTLYVAPLQFADDTNSTVKYIAIDSAGNVQDTANEFVVRVDKTAPTVNPDDVNNVSWRNSALTETFSASDGGSGLALNRGLTAAGGFTLTASAESASATTPTTDSKTVRDVAGNETTRTLSAKIDVTEPSVSGPQSVSTWSKAASVESLDFTASDALSGIPAADERFKLTATRESTKVGGTVVPTTETRTVTDAAGNSQDASFSALIDRTAPTVSLVGAPANGSTVWSTQTAPTCEASDALSGMASSCTVTGFATTVGQHTVTATATDEAGNVGTATSTYTVRDLTHTGFFQPVDMNGVYNAVKGGSTVPLKFTLAINGVNQSDLSLVTAFTSNLTSCSSSAAVDDVEIVTTGNTALRYDSTAGQFVQSYKTATGAGTCYRATATLADGDKITALFNLK